jgi:hypothetical protein
MAMSGTCVNPVLYALLNTAFRQAFRAAVPCGRRNVHRPKQKDRSVRAAETSDDRQMVERVLVSNL